MDIHTDRLILAELSPADLNEVHRLHSIPEVDEFNTLGIPGDLEETRTQLQKDLDAKEDLPRKLYSWTIRLRISAAGATQQEGGSFIGLCGFSLSQDKYRLGEIWYKLDPRFWGQGYATEVAKALVRTGFEDFNLHKVEAGVAIGNLRSIRVLEKCGLTREGLRRKVLPIRGEWVDNYHYAILEDDPRDY